MMPCCPLFRPTEEDLFDQVATGTLLKAGGKHFMLTAGHVCDQLAEANFIFPSARGFSILHGTVARRDPEKTADIYDYGFVLLDEKTADDLQHYFTFAEPKDADVNEYALEGDWYSFAGYPYRKRKIYKKLISTPVYSYHVQAASKQSYYNVGVNPYSHIICKFDRKRYADPRGRHITAPLPHGIGGGPIINYTKESDPRGQKLKSKLAGICTEYHADDNLLIGVRIAGFVQSIIHMFPDLSAEFEKIVLLT